MRTILKLALALVGISGTVWGQHTYYVSFSTGADTNTSTQAQSKSTPWKHVPGMRSGTGNLASYTPVAGDTFIVRGCDVYTGTDMPITWTWSGSAGNVITVGIDQSWFNATNCPSGWNRPVLNGGLAIINPPECTNDNVFLRFSSAQYVTFNWIEATGFFWASMVGNGGSCGAHSGMVVDATASDFIALNNWYIHHWDHGGTSSNAQDTDHAIDIETASIPGDAPYCAHCVFNQGVIDNTDGPNAPGCSPATTGAPSGGPCGFGVQWSTTNSVFNYMVNAIKPKTHSGNFGNNFITGVQGPSFDGTHENIIEPVVASNPVVCCYYIHDNLITGNPLGELQFGNTGETYYIWNNVHVADSTRSWAFPQQPGPGMSLFMWNNTIIPESSQPGILTCLACNPATWTNVFINNNHVITTSTASSNGSPAGLIGCSDCGESSPFPVTGAQSFTKNIVVTPTNAASQGYTNGTTYIYSPQNGTCNGIPTNCPIGAGINLTSSWPAGFATGDTTYGCVESTVSGVVQSVCSQRASNTRPSSGAWDPGAYEFAATNQTLTVTVSGSGTVNDNLSEISCPPTCLASYATGASVVLTATPNSSQTFSGWSGAGCSGTSTCSITMNSAESVTATFAPSGVTGPSETTSGGVKTLGGVIFN